MTQERKIRRLDMAFNFPNLAPRERLVGLVMARRANQTGICFMGQKRIAEETGYDERTVRRAVRELRRIEFLKEVKRDRGPPTKHYRVLDAYALGG